MLTAQERHPECSAGPEWYGYLGIIDTEAITGAPAVGRPSKSAGCLAAQKKNSCRQSRRTSTWPPIDRGGARNIAQYLRLESKACTVQTNVDTTAPVDVVWSLEQVQVPDGMHHNDAQTITTVLHDNPRLCVSHGKLHPGVLSIQPRRVAPFSSTNCVPCGSTRDR